MKFSVTLLSSLLLLGATVQNAAAHIDLTYPPMNGGNQKGAPPCGGNAATPVTTFKPGETIMVKFTETVYHPGHFRIAVFGEGMAAPADPTSYTDIKMPAVAPILADGLFKHTSGGRKAWETPVTLPNITCAKCSLQLIQVMQEGAFNQGSLYRRCANIVLAGAAAGPADGGAADGGGGSPDAGASDAGGAGTGGSSGGTGGSSGGTGGSSGSGGSTAGTGGTSGGSGGATAGSGGTSGGSGGSTASSGGSSGTARGGSTGTANPSSSDAGGGCSIGGAGSESQSSAWALLALVMGAGFASRRRTRSRSR